MHKILSIFTIFAGTFFAFAGTQIFAAGDDFYWQKPQIAWRGERVNFAFPQELPNQKFVATVENSAGTRLPANVLFAHRTTGDNDQRFYDVLRPERLPAASRQFVFVTIDVPADAPAGKFELKIDGKTRGNLEILPLAFPQPRDWKFHLDLWQHPQAVARWCGVPAWSDAHFDAMRPVMTRLAQAGQKVVTAAIIEEPWDHQTYDDWPSMVKWKRDGNGDWSFDFTIFDKWILFMESCGIDLQIDCYTMLPWSKKLGFTDADGNAQTIELEPGTELFERTWFAFLTAFEAHLRERGWLEKTCIALDERPDEMAQAARAVLALSAPKIKIASAVNRPSREQDFAYDLSPLFNFTDDISEFAKSRRGNGKITTFYVCCAPQKPNTFTHSSPTEAHWLGLYASAKKLDGFLRWAYNSWTENPFVSTKHRAKNWPAGDCFLVFPPNFSTLRFEALRDGIEDFEKICILRERLSPAELEPLEKYLQSTFKVNFAPTASRAFEIHFARQKIAEASKKLAEKEQESKE